MSFDVAARNPTTGIAGCCARTVSGHAAAAPPSSVMNSRRLIFEPPPPESVHRTLSLPQSGRRVLSTDLNYSEYEVAFASTSIPQLGGSQHDNHGGLAIEALLDLA